MKALWIVGLAIALAGCGLPPAETTSLATIEMRGEIGGAHAFIPISAKAGPAMERPQEIVGTENHRAVLDGAS